HEAFRIPLTGPSSPAGGTPRELFRPPSFFSLSMARTQDGRTLFLTRQSQVLVWHSSEPDQIHALELPNLPETPDLGRERTRRVDPPEPGGRRGEPTGPGTDRDGRRTRFSWQKIVAAPDGTRLYLIDNPDHRVHALALDGDQPRWLDWSLEIR